MSVEAVLKSKAFRLFDWSVAIGALAWGAYSLYTGDQVEGYLALGGGLLGLYLAWSRPAERMSVALRRKFIRGSARS